MIPSSTVLGFILNVRNLTERIAKITKPLLCRGDDHDVYSCHNIIASIVNPQCHHTRLNSGVKRPEGLDVMVQSGLDGTFLAAL